MSNINVMRKNLGPVTAYKYAVQQGYTGTEQEFAALMASYASIAQDVSAESRIAEGYALGKQNGVDVGDQSPYYHANARYHAEQAAAKAQEAAESAAQAEGAIEVDETLSVEGRAADAKATGKVKNDLSAIKTLDFDLFSGVTWSVGAILITTGVDTASSNTLRTDYISLADIDSFKVSVDSGYKYLVALVNAEKTSMVNECSYSLYEREYLLSDYPDAAFVRVIYRTVDDVLPVSSDYIHGTYTSNFTDFVDSALKSGHVTYHDISPKLQAVLAYKYKDSPEDITFSNTNTILRVDGTLYSFSGSYAVSDYIDCSGWLSMKYSGRHYYDGQGLAFYDENEKFLECYPNTKSGTHNYTDVVIPVPKNAKYIRVAQISNVQTIVYISTEFMPSNTGYKWKGKKWCCIGDSLTEVNSVAAKRYHDYVAESTGITVVNLGVGGTGYMNGSTGNNPFRNRISQIPSDADVITIFGSFNDLGETRPLGTKTDTGFDTIGGCMNETFDALFDEITLANVGVITPTPWANAYPLDNESSNQYKYVQLLKDICERRGIPCLDLFHCSQLRPWDAAFRSLAYSKDSTGVHPDETGHRIIAPRFEGFLDTLLM